MIYRYCNEYRSDVKLGIEKKKLAPLYLSIVLLSHLIPTMIPSHLSTLPKLPEWESWTKLAIKLSFILIVCTLVAFLPLPGMTPASRVMLGIFLLGALLWITEVIPPFATAIIVVVLQVYLLGKPEGLLGLGKQEIDNSYLIFLNPIASPVMVLFFGGFIMALAASKHGLSRHIVEIFFRPFAKTPCLLLMGVIGVTALFSMFMSNTATTAMMAAIIYPFATELPSNVKFRKGLILAVPFAANIGGMGTIIGSPPNAVAVSVLGSLGYEINFLQWMLFGVPLMVILLTFLCLLIWFLYPIGSHRIEMPEVPKPRITHSLAAVMGVFTITVLCWLTEPLHGVPSAVVALLPVMIFTLMGLIDAEDLKKIEWNVLFLIVGGLSMGVGMQRTGLSEILVNQIPHEALSISGLLLIFSVITIIISNFMSNTSTANIIIPIASAMTSFSPVFGAIIVALSASLAMSLPISTPPNSIAYGSGLIKTKDMLILGSLVSILGIIVISVFLLKTL